MVPLRIIFACFFLLGCDQKLTAIQTNKPQESSDVTFRRASLQFDNLKQYPFVQGLISSDASGRVDFSALDFCDAAKVVLGDALAIPYTCAGVGKFSLYHPSNDPASLMSLFVAVVERLGGTFEYSGEAVVVTGPPVEKSQVFGFIDADGVVELDQLTGGPAGASLSPIAAEDDVRVALSYYAEQVLRPLPSNVSSDEVNALARQLGIDLKAIDLAGRSFVHGDTASSDVLLDMISGSATTVLTVPASGLSQALFSVLKSRFSDLDLAYDPATSTVAVAGYSDRVLKAIDALNDASSSAPVTRFEALIFSYSQSKISDLETKLNLDVNTVSPVVGSLSTGPVSSGISLVANQISSEGFGQVIARPSLTGVVGDPMKFNSGVDVPYRSSVDPETGSETIDYRQTGLTLTLHPRLISPDTFKVSVFAELSDVKNGDRPDTPQFETRSAETTVVMRRGSTVLLSGLIQQNRASSDASSFFLPTRSRSDQVQNIGVYLMMK